MLGNVLLYICINPHLHCVTEVNFRPMTRELDLTRPCPHTVEMTYPIDQLYNLSESS